MLSNTEHDILGQNRISTGSGALNSIKVFKVGSVPAIFGSVLILLKSLPNLGATKLLRLNYKKAFFTGNRPGD